MVFKKIILHNFRSFIGEHTFTISDSGLFLVTGKNQIDQKLEGNGAGKSSLGEAIFYAFEGQTSRGLKRPDILSWGYKHCDVTIEFLYKDIFHRISRVDTKVIITINEEQTEISSQQSIYDFIGLPKQFLKMIIFSQFKKGFFSQTPKQRLEYFCDLFGFEIWDSYQNNAKNHLSELFTEQNKLEIEQGKIESWILALKDTEKNMLFEKNLYEKEQAARKKVFVAAQQTLKNEVKTLKTTQKQLSDTQPFLKTKLSEITLEKTKQNKKITALLLAIAAEEKGLYFEQHNNTQIDKKIKHIEKLTAQNTCLECGAEIPKELLEEQKKALNTQKQEATEIIAEVKTKLKTSNTKLTSIKSVVEQLQKTERSIEQELQETFRACNGINTQINSKTKELCKKFQPETDHTANILRETQNNLKVLLRYQNVQEQFFSDLKAKEIVTKYWKEKGFSQIKLSIIEKIAMNYTIFCNNYLAKLGLPDWEIMIQMQKELKSGAVRAQFEIFIKNKLANKSVPLSVWSGGEFQRLKLAGDLALSDLIGSWYDFKCNITIFDEQSQHLSPAGKTALLQILKEKSKKINVYTIEHEDFINNGLFDKIITIQKTGEGSSFEV